MLFLSLKDLADGVSCIGHALNRLKAAECIAAMMYRIPGLKKVLRLMPKHTNMLDAEIARTYQTQSNVFMSFDYMQKGC
jgi:hypothetical protein